MSPSRLHEWFPWTEAPLIINAPMAGVVSHRMATEVTMAGGLGLLRSNVNVEHGSPDLSNLEDDLKYCSEHLDKTKAGRVLPVGISFLTGHSSITQFPQTALPLIEKYNPAAVWLFAPKEAVKPHGPIIQAIKSLPLPPRVIVQVGNVAAAREAVLDGADVLTCQGIDAGGHQFQRGTGAVVLLLEVRRMLREEFRDRDVCLLAAGGIVDGTSAAAMFTAEAEGIVMGTRFTICDESTYPDFRKQQVLDAKDGGSSTIKSPFVDHIGNFDIFWGHAYDGRSLASAVHEKYLAGVSFEECRRSLKEDYAPEEAEKMINTWAGTAVGLIDKRQPAGEIVRQVREETKQAIKRVSQLPWVESM